MTPPPDPGNGQMLPLSPDTGTSAQILIELGKLSTQLAVMNEQLKAVPDHEQRIRGLERWKYSLPIALLLALASDGLAVFATLAHH